MGKTIEQMTLGELYIYLSETNYVTDELIDEYIDGVIEEKEYLLIKEERQKWRDEIKKLEVLINGWYYIKSN